MQCKQSAFDLQGEILESNDMIYIVEIIKFEILNPKLETISKSACPPMAGMFKILNQKKIRPFIRIDCLGHLNFEIRICLGFRYSNFGFYTYDY